MYLKETMRKIGNTEFQLGEEYRGRDAVQTRGLAATGGGMLRGGGVQ